MTTKAHALALLCLALSATAFAGDDAPSPERHPFRMPPQEAIAACAKLSLDAACTFTFDGRHHEGTCRRGPEGQGPIACAPTRHDKGAPGTGPGKGQGQGPERGSEQRPRATWGGPTSGLGRT
jgi:hypothetical protein